jgi:hypothetical protein
VIAVIAVIGTTPRRSDHGDLVNYLRDDYFAKPDSRFGFGWDLLASSPRADRYVDADANT